MTRVTKTAFDKTGSFQLLDTNYGVLNVISNSTTTTGAELHLTNELKESVECLLKDLSIFTVENNENNANNENTEYIPTNNTNNATNTTDEYSDTPPGINIFYGSSRVVQLWYMNAEQIRQIFWYYARSVDINRHSKLKQQQLNNGNGNGAHNGIHDFNHTAGTGSNSNGNNNGNGSNVGVNMLTFENCKEFLMDFGIVPKYIDIPTLTRIYRNVKLWEWYMGELYLIDRLVTAATLKQPVQSSPKDGTNSNTNGNTNGNTNMNINLSQVLNLDSTHCFHDTYPYDYTTSLGNLSLTIW